jgi:hypothetical protein
MLEFLLIVIVVGLVAIAVLVAAFLGTTTAWGFKQGTRRENRIVLGCLGSIFVAAFLLWLWVNSLSSP